MIKRCAEARARRADRAKREEKMKGGCTWIDVDLARNQTKKHNYSNPFHVCARTVTEQGTPISFSTVKWNRQPGIHGRWRAKFLLALSSPLPGLSRSKEAARNTKRGCRNEHGFSKRGRNTMDYRQRFWLHCGRRRKQFLAGYGRHFPFHIQDRFQRGRSSEVLPFNAGRCDDEWPQLR